MSIKSVTTDDLRHMQKSEGLILQGCGGEAKEWLDGINDILTNENILLDGSRFENCCVFNHDGVTCLLFPFDEKVKLDMGKLAVWRLKSHVAFGGTWLSDYVPNKLGGFITEKQEKTKPDCQLIGQNGNIFNLMGIASQTLRRNGMRDEAEKMCERIRASGSYSEALNIIGDYVNITSADDVDIDETEDEGMNMSF